jgi:hypothetical protein
MVREEASFHPPEVEHHASRPPMGAASLPLHSLTVPLEFRSGNAGNRERREINMREGRPGASKSHLKFYQGGRKRRRLNWLSVTFIKQAVRRERVTTMTVMTAMTNFAPIRWELLNVGANACMPLFTLLKNSTWY